MPEYTVIIRKLSSRYVDGMSWSQCLVFGRNGAAAHVSGDHCIRISVTDRESGLPTVLVSGRYDRPFSLRDAQSEYDRALLGDFRLRLALSKSGCTTARDVLSFIEQELGVTVADHFARDGLMFVFDRDEASSACQAVDSALASLPDDVVLGVR